jgi:hypothetical protein
MRAGKEAEMASMWLWRKRNEDCRNGCNFRGCHGSTETTEEEG